MPCCFSHPVLVFSQKGGVAMFTEELARDVGIAYALYCLDCEYKGIEAKTATDFATYVTGKIEEIRRCKGLVSENDVCG